MTLLPAGTEVEYTVTYLEMTSRPSYDRPSLPVGPPTALIAADTPPVRYFLDLYRAVGEEWMWHSRLLLDDGALSAILNDPKVETYTLKREDVERLNMTTHPVEFDMYYSV